MLIKYCLSIHRFVLFKYSDVFCVFNRTGCHFLHRRLSFYSFAKRPVLGLYTGLVCCNADKKNVNLLKKKKKRGKDFILLELYNSKLTQMTALCTYGKCVRRSALLIRTLTLAYPLVAFMTVHARSI